MDATLSRNEEKNKRKGMITSIVVHTLLVMLAILPLLTYPDPPPGQEGILVNLGIPDVGQGDENAPPAPKEEAAPPTTREEERQPEPEEVEPEKPVEKPQKQPEKRPEKQPERKVVTADNEAELALKKQREKEARERAEREARERARREAEERKRREAEERARREAEERARKEAEAKKLEELIGSGLGGGRGEGKGNTGQPGNQGDPNGGDSDIVTGTTSGQGRVGGGLRGRGILAQPPITDRSQKTGTVMLRVCVNANGDVIEATYTQAGSTTSDARLVSLAIANAKRWKFSKGNVDRQCGTIRYDFKVR